MYNEENEKINAEENADFTENDVNEENVSVSDEDLYDDGDDFDGDIDGDDFDADKNYDKDDIKYLHQPSELLSRRTARAEKWKRVRENRISFKDFTHSRLFKILLTVICAIAAVFAIVYTVCIVTLPSDTVSRNVYVENINVSGLSYDNALAAIKNAYLLGEQKIVLSCGGETYSVNGADVALTASPEETAKMAFEYGKSGNKLKDGFTAFSLLFKKRVILPSASFDEEKMREKINDFGNRVLGERKNHYVEILEDKTIVWPGKTGYDGNCDAALNEITEAVKNERFNNIEVTFAKAAPDELTLEAFDGAVYADPTDAYYQFENGEVKVIAETNGRYINKEEAAALLVNVKEGGAPVEIPFYHSYAAVTAGELQTKLFADNIASYSTSYASSGANRASNVARAASLINGKILMPGDVFSFNDTVGKRTVENGFKTAPEYVDGKTVDGIGGGTCQVSSTLYNAVLYADLEIVTRTNHMFTVAYVPNGQDATVADSGPDFKFKNNTAYPIKIAAYTGSGKITVVIIGTNWSPSHSVKISNSSSYNDKGDTYVKTTRTVTSNGEVIKKESLPSSVYKKHSEEASSSQSSSSSGSSYSSSSGSSSGSSTSSSRSEESESSSDSGGDESSESDNDDGSDE